MFQIKRRRHGTNLPHTVRFPEELCESLAQIAQDNDVSFNSLVIQCCNYAIRNIDNTDKTNKEQK